MADSQLQKHDLGSESTFPTQTRDTVTHRDRELEKETVQWRMALGKLGSCNTERAVPRCNLDSEILRKSSGDGGETCGHIEVPRRIVQGDPDGDLKRKNVETFKTFGKREYEIKLRLVLEKVLDIQTPDFS